MHRRIRIFERLKDDFSRLANAQPGRRFIEHHERHHQSAKRRENGWKTAAYLVVGLVLLLAGLLLSLPPGMPGFLLWVPGLGILVARLRVFALS